MDRAKTSERVSLLGIFVNTFLAIVKLLSGILANSTAMISDAVNSLSDIFSGFVVLFGVRAGNKQADAEHRYGHERLECSSAIILSVVMVIVGGGVGYSAVRGIISGSVGELTPPRAEAMVVAAITILVKTCLFIYTRRMARLANSTALAAQAVDHRNDIFSSLGGLVGIIGARAGLPVLDPIAGLVICVLILKGGVDIFRDAMDKLTDKSCDPETEAEICRLVLAQHGVLGIDDLKTRLFGDKIYVDIEVSADAMLRLGEAHHIAEHVHNVIEREIPNVKHCMVHMNPK